MRAQFSTTERPTRWTVPFDPDMTDDTMDQILAIAPFQGMDPGNFPRAIPLRSIVRHDMRLRRFGQGELVVREGDYGHSAFMVISGTVKVVVSPSLPPEVLGRRVTKRKSLLRVIAQLWSNRLEPESASSERQTHDSWFRTGRSGSDAHRIFLQDVPRLLDGRRISILEEGEFFGEIAALSRTPRTATVVVPESAELLEIRWQGLRDLMRYDGGLREHIDRIYHDRALKSHLLAIPLFRGLSEEALQAVMRQTTPATYGQYEWSGDYKRMAQSDPALRTAREPLIAQEGDYPNGVHLIRAGFARLSHRHGQGERTLNYLGAGRDYGVAEIVHNWRHAAAPTPLRYSLRAMGYTHVLFVPTSVIEEAVLPTLSREALEALGAGAMDEGESARDVPGYEDMGAKIGAEKIDFLADHRFYNGTASMVIDLDRCTRCDDCVRACATAHGNNPRFLRQGPSLGRLMIANACMHCVDPVCMIGCPTGAIARNDLGGQVVINPSTCIGCKTCFNNCPYDAIRMVETRDENGGFRVDHEMKPILKATKCDLCVEQIGGPSCERACPHGALTRVNLSDLKAFADWNEA